VRLTVWVVISMVAGVVDKAPPAIVVLVLLLSRLTCVAGVPGLVP